MRFDIMALMLTGFTIGILYLLFAAPYLLAKGIFTLKYGYCDKSDKIKCAIPFYNLYVAETLYTQSFPVMAITSLLTIMMALIRIVIMFVAPGSIMATIVVLILFIVMLIAFCITSSIFVARIIDKTDSVYGFKKILYIILFPLGEYYIGNYLAIAIKNEKNAVEAI